MPEPSRGDIWAVDLDPVLGHEQAGRRPALVISVDLFNHGPAELVVVLPITSKPKGIPLHVRIAPPEGGVKTPSYVKCEDIRSVSRRRLSRFWGRVSAQTISEIEERLRVLLGIQ
jgi:mRNA interferase MazF